jgi:hypothetical protein
MLGWHISVFRQASGGSAPASADSERGTRLAVWQTGLWGIGWLQELVKQGHAVDLGGTGYPCRYTAQAAHLTPRLIDGPPEANARWVSEPHDILLPHWEGKTVIDRTAIDACRPDEWLLVVAWDES